MVYFDFVRASNCQKSCVWYCSMAKRYQTLVWKSLMGILFNFVLSIYNTRLCTPGIHMYCNYLLTTKVTALQVVRTTSFQHSFISGLPRQSLLLSLTSHGTVLLSLTSHGTDPEYMSMIMCNLRGLDFLLCAWTKGFLLLVPGITDSKWDLKTGQCRVE